jgi:hypothetical protein
MKFQPLLHTPNFTKRTNDKLYKIELATNDDDRELAETDSMAEVTNEITEQIQIVIGFAQDFNNQLASYSTLRTSTTTRDLIGTIPATGKFNVAIDKVLRLISSTDFNDVSPQNIDGMTSYLDNLDQLSQSIMNQNLTVDAVRNPQIAELFRQADNIRTQILVPLDQLINVLRTKMLSRRQTSEVLGSGCMCDKYGLFNTNQYQTKHYI